MKPDGHSEGRCIVIPHSDVRRALKVGGLVDSRGVISQRRESLLNLRGGDGASKLGSTQRTCGVVVWNHGQDMTGQGPMLALKQLCIICLHPWGGNIIRWWLLGSDVSIDRQQILRPCCPRRRGHWVVRGLFEACDERGCLCHSSIQSLLSGDPRVPACGIISILERGKISSLRGSHRLPWLISEALGGASWHGALPDGGTEGGVLKLDLGRGPAGLFRPFKCRHRSTCPSSATLQW